MQINTNPIGLMAANALNLANQEVLQSSQRLSTGLRVNSATDDPGSMIMLNSIKAKIGSWAVANKNIISANGMLETMSASLKYISDTLTSMKVLAVTSSLAVNDAAAAANQTKFAEYMAKIDSRSAATQWNGISLLTNNSTSTVTGVAIADTTGTFTSTANANLDVGQKLTVSGTWGVDGGSITSYTSPTSYLVSAVTGGVGTVTGFTLVNLDGTAITTTAGTTTGASFSATTPLAGGTVNIQTGVETASQTAVNLYNTSSGYLGSTDSSTNFRLNLKNLNTITNATSAIVEIDKAITQISSYQSSVGVNQNIMTSETSLNNNLSTASTNAYTKLTNVDTAKETALLAAATIRQSSSAAMLAQANQMNKDIVTTLLHQFIR